MLKLLLNTLSVLCLVTFVGCSTSHGPRAKVVKESPELNVFHVCSLSDVPPAQGYPLECLHPPFNSSLTYREVLAARDVIQVVITDTDSNSPFYRPGSAYELGPFEIPSNGSVKIPYAGEVKVAGFSIAELNRTLNYEFGSVSNTADVTVFREKRFDYQASVIGGVSNPGSFEIDRKGYSSLDLIAASGGGKEHPDSYLYKLNRDGQTYCFNYDSLSNHPFAIQDGDVISVEQDPGYSYYTMGQFNTPGRHYLKGANTSIADAIAESGGFNSDGDAKGLFVFRAVAGVPEVGNKVYVIDVQDPKYPFIIQNFKLTQKDIVYLSESPLSQMNKVARELAPIIGSGVTAYAIGSR